MELTDELAGILKRYRQIQQQEKQLADEKKVLQDQLMQHLGNQSTIWNTQLEEEQLKVRYTVREQINYNETLLKERLGSRYSEILKPDINKVRKHLGEVEMLLKPALLLVGSPHRDMVKQAIHSGAVNMPDFEGAFEREVRCTVAVSAR
jgi:hypothetical protein